MTPKTLDPQRTVSELEADLHRHIHKENHILFPAAQRLEAECG